MSKVIINNFDEFAQLVGKRIGVSDYVQVTQERINLFADATLDHQWIHVDTERAKVESAWVSDIVSVATPVGSDHSGEQSAHDGELWHGQDEIRTGCALRAEHPYDCRSGIAGQSAWHS